MNYDAKRIAPAPIRKSLRVKASLEKAFDIFVGGMGRWWLKTHTLLEVPQKDVMIELRSGGRWYEIGEDGSEQDWGKVVEWRRPYRIVLRWQLSADFAYDPTLETTVEASFTADGDHTVVEFEHRDLERYGDRAAAIRDSMDDGWSALLAGYERAAEAEPAI